MVKEFIDYKDISFKVKTLGSSCPPNNFFNEQLMLYPLYKKIKLDNSNKTCDIFPYNDYRLELFCPICKKRRIFCFQNSEFVEVYWGPNNIQYCNSVEEFLSGVDYFSVRAQADCEHNLLVIFKKIDDSTIMKVGQYPSIYDLNEEINNRTFLKMLDEEYEGYYKNACSLYSFNTCIGAIIYLRRIFEKILLDTYNENKESIDLSLEDFKKLRMENKLKKIRNHLPSILFEHGFNIIYTKISDGVHNLSEDECQQIFPILKNAIEEILIDKLEMKEKQKRRQDISKQISNL